MIRTFIAAKLHNITVTGARLEYHGSVTIGSNMMQAAGIQPYEQVHVVNLNTGDRWITYALPGKHGVFELNGGGARCGVVGDRCVVMTYKQIDDDDRFPGAVVIELDEINRFVAKNTYPGEE